MGCASAVETACPRASQEHNNYLTIRIECRLPVQKVLVRCILLVIVK